MELKGKHSFLIDVSINHRDKRGGPGGFTLWAAGPRVGPLSPCSGVEPVSAVFKLINYPPRKRGSGVDLAGPSYGRLGASRVGLLILHPLYIDFK